MPTQSIKSAADFETLDDCLRYCVGPGNPFRPPKDWAAILGLALSTLYSKGNAEGTVPFTLRDLVTITTLGVTLPLEFLALRGKCVVYPMPEVDPDSDPLDLQAAESTITCGEFLKSYGAARDPRGPGGREVVVKEAKDILGHCLRMVTIHTGICEAMRKIIDQEN